MSGPATQTTGGTVFALLQRVLDFMSTPWRAIVVIVLAILGGIGWAAWTERQALLGLFQHHPRELKKDADLDPVLRDLLSDTDADLVMVWTVNLPINELIFHRSIKRGGGIWPQGDVRLPALTELGHLVTVVKLLNGETVCAASKDYPGNLLLRRLSLDGYPFFCAVPVPPAANESVLGILYFAWHRAPDQLAEHAAVVIGRAATEHMVVRH
jgi:hypothetical protein